MARLQLSTFAEWARRVVLSPGLWGAGAALIAQRLLRSTVVDAPFAPYSAAEWVIRKTPGPIATEGIERLGHSAQPILAWSFIGGALLIGLVLDRRPSWLIAAAAFVLTLVAAWLDPLSRSVSWAFGAGALAAVAAFLGASTVQPRGPVAAHETNWSRRRFVWGAGLAVLLGSAGAASILREGVRATPSGPVRADAPAVVPRDLDFPTVRGLSPRVTPRAEHYTVDIDLENPFISESDWELKVDGAVLTPHAYTLSDLEAMRTREELFNVSCISNRVGGHLIGNSRWTGVPLDALLDASGLLPAAVSLLAKSYDGYEECILLDDIVGQGALVAIGMNGRLLPRDHGFPARMLFPDHYGMRSVKWLTQIEVIDRYQEGYWASRGWDQDAVVRTQSRIDTPGNGDSVPASFVCAGIAWAGARRISGVEVSADGGETWQAAHLEAELSALSWRRWQVALDLPPGEHTIVVRAADGTGAVQDEQERDPHPSGASGYHEIGVTVSPSG